MCLGKFIREGRKVRVKVKVVQSIRNREKGVKREEASKKTSFGGRKRVEGFGE